MAMPSKPKPGENPGVSALVTPMICVAPARPARPPQIDIVRTSDAGDVHAGVARARRVEPDGAELETERGPVQQPGHERGRDQGQDEAQFTAARR